MATQNDIIQVDNRQRVLDLTLQGYGIEYIADELHIDTDTVKSHLNAIMPVLTVQTIELQNRWQQLWLARTERLLTKFMPAIESLDPAEMTTPGGAKVANGLLKSVLSIMKSQSDLLKPGEVAKQSKPGDVHIHNMTITADSDLYAQALRSMAAPDNGLSDGWVAMMEAPPNDIITIEALDSKLGQLERKLDLDLNSDDDDS